MGCGPIGGSPVFDQFGGYGFAPQPLFARPQPRVPSQPAPKPVAPPVVVPVRVLVPEPGAFGIDLSEPLTVPDPTAFGIDLE